MSATRKHCMGSGSELRSSWSGVVWYVVSLQGHGLVVLQAVTVDPLSHAGGGDDGGRQDGTAAHASEAILLAATTEADLNAASEGVAVDGTGAVAELAVDGEHGLGLFGMWLVYRALRSTSGHVVPVRLPSPAGSLRSDLPGRFPDHLGRWRRCRH